MRDAPAVTALDWVIIAFVALLALYGYGQGFLVGALSLAGFAAGAFLGTRLAPHLLPEGAASPYAPMFGLLGALIVGGTLAMGLEGLGMALRQRFETSGAAVLDGLLGAMLTACLGFAIAWIIGAVALHIPGSRSMRDDIRRSVLLSKLNTTLPPSGPILNTLARIDPFPDVQGPGPAVSAPDSAIARDPDVQAAASSVVRVLGTACGLGIQGSGWVVAPGFVVTNAHVVAGQEDTAVQLDGNGRRLDAQAVRFDIRNDLAILRVPGLDREGLDMAFSPPRGTQGAVLGFPGNGPYDVEPARLGGTVVAASDDAYGRGPIRRPIALLRAAVQQGNSGGPMVDGNGHVVATVFAARVGGSTPGGYGIPNSIVREDLQAAAGAVSTGPCVP